MTVRELIEQASQLDPNAIIFLEKGGQLIGTLGGIGPVGNEEDDEEREAEGDGPLRDNWRAAINLEPGPAASIWFDEVS